MTTGTALLFAATQTLRAAGVDDPAGDARVLLAYALGIDRSRLTLVLPDEVDGDRARAFENAITARAARQPVAQITGTRAFYGRDFIVTPDVLDPRPETELLVDTALEAPFSTVLDLGTGSGCILLTLLAENVAAEGLGVDLSGAALEVAKRNAQALDVLNRVRFREASWFEDMQSNAHFDLIVSNPPYISAAEMAELSPDVKSWEPHLALTPGGDGLDAYRVIASGAPCRLTPGGRLMVEIGATQGDAVKALFDAAGFLSIQVLKDLSGHDRVVVGHLAPER